MHYIHEIRPDPTIPETDHPFWAATSLPALQQASLHLRLKDGNTPHLVIAPHLSEAHWGFGLMRWDTRYWGRHLRCYEGLGNVRCMVHFFSVQNEVNPVEYVARYHQATRVLGDPGFPTIYLPEGVGGPGFVFREATDPVERIPSLGFSWFSTLPGHLSYFLLPGSGMGGMRVETLRRNGIYRTIPGYPKTYLEEGPCLPGHRFSYKDKATSFHPLG